MSNTEEEENNYIIKKDFSCNIKCNRPRLIVLLLKKISKDLKTCSSANKITQNAYSKFQKT
jgi:hypothetical protein